MFDPEILLDERLAAECNVAEPEFFIPVPSGSENEVKGLTTRYADFLLVRDNIRSKNNRIIDPRSFTIKAKPLITLNIDTVNPKTGEPTQRFRKAGLSGRIRFEANADDDLSAPQKIDFSFKTLYCQGNVVELRPQRGEWEAILENLEPDFGALRTQTAKCKNPLPRIFSEEYFSPDEIRVTSIGCCWRREYTHFHSLANFPGVVAYSQMEDVTMFTTPHADAYEADIDIEMEAEVKGTWGASVKNIDYNALDQQHTTSVRRTHQLILSSSPSIHCNRVTKAERGNIAIDKAYRDFCDPTLTRYFNVHRMTPEMFALWQGVQTHEVSLKNIGYILAKMRHDLKLHVDGQEYSSFQYV